MSSPIKIPRVFVGGYPRLTRWENALSFPHAVDDRDGDSSIGCCHPCFWHQGISAVFWGAFQGRPPSANPQEASMHCLLPRRYWFLVEGEVRDDTITVEGLKKLLFGHPVAPRDVIRIIWHMYNRIKVPKCHNIDNINVRDMTYLVAWTGVPINFLRNIIRMTPAVVTTFLQGNDHSFRQASNDKVKNLQSLLTIQSNQKAKRKTKTNEQS